MRTRATAAAAILSGALALTALAVPAAQATGTGAALTPARAHALVHQFASGQIATTGRSTLSAHTPMAQPYALDFKFSALKINGGKPIVVGPTAKVTVPVTYTVTYGSDVDITADDFFFDVDLYKGSADDPDNNLFADNEPVCKVTSSTTTDTDVITVAGCTTKIVIRPKVELDSSDAGKGWKAEGVAVAFNGEDPSSKDFDPSKIGLANQSGLASTSLQRASILTVNAKPEPVKKGKTLTIVGKLTRANWETNKNAGYTKQPVQLQFRKKNTTKYVTVKTVKSGSGGNLKTTTKAKVSGYWRYSFAGNSTTPAVNAPGDYVAVK
ncbi:MULTISPECIES: hypothetical protein [unclassified Streptomyces]|uniref:hypothetical protein n=1 Tax=unclassified Streptomyces TaxID=2593676 RepID=UPI002E29539A|nr:hypothetical protein [Streptomyces sp. NBC_00223]